jgi:tetratricopeptide (TPR) repeat protein
MRTSVLAFTFLLALTSTACSTSTVQGESQPTTSFGPRQSPATEEAWIKSEVMTSITALAQGDGVPDASRVTVVDHVWSPATYLSLATPLFKRDAANEAPNDSELNTGSRLTTLTAATLLDENDRVSAALQASPRSPSAHEAAALLLGAFALREDGWLEDTRPALSRMSAHLTAAEVLRGARRESQDGVLARAVMLTLIGRQADALAILDTIERAPQSEAAQAWVHALRLRNTGDWRKARSIDAETMLERYEHGRALRERLGHDALLTYLDTVPEFARDVIDWARIAMVGSYTVEAGNLFTPANIGHELDESAAIWQRYHEGTAGEPQLLEALNAAPSTIATDGKRRVLDWGLWAGQQQRHLLQAAVTSWQHAGNFGGRAELGPELEHRFSALALFPIVQRWIAESPGAYELALTRARVLVERRPELVPQSAWTSLLEKPNFVTRAAAFPLDTVWFTPPVPTGTAFDLAQRSLRPGCQRPPTRAQALVYAKQRPYDHWAVWSNEWYAVDGTPTLAAVVRALNPLFDYDSRALLKMIEYMRLSDGERLGYAKQLCELVPAECDRLGQLHLAANRPREAVAAFERWVALTRDRVEVANGVLWLVRHYDSNRDAARAEAMARMAADVGSARGLDVLGEWLDRHGHHAEAEQIYRKISQRYSDAGYLLGSFLMRKAARTGNNADRAEAGEMLRDVFPSGVESLQRHALDATAQDGATFLTFGARAAAMGLRPSDVVVGIDGWRVRNAGQYLNAARFSYDPTMTFTVWRDGRYTDVKANVPERLLGTTFTDYRPTRQAR